MRQEKNILTRDNVTESVHIVSLYFCTRYPPRYGDRVERTQDKEAYMESRTAREGLLLYAPQTAKTETWRRDS